VVAHRARDRGRVRALRQAGEDGGSDEGVAPGLLDHPGDHAGVDGAEGRLGERGDLVAGQGGEADLVGEAVLGQGSDQAPQLTPLGGSGPGRHHQQQWGSERVAAEVGDELPGRRVAVVNVIEDEGSRPTPRDPGQQGPNRFERGEPGRALCRPPAKGRGDAGEEPRQLLLPPRCELDQASIRQRPEVASRASAISP
jgi:hypothetical protein